jgi:hypothetical protein
MTKRHINNSCFNIITSEENTVVISCILNITINWKKNNNNKKQQQQNCLLHSLMLGVKALLH